MPCQACKVSFSGNIPCLHPTGKLGDEEHVYMTINKVLQGDKYGYDRCMKDIYKELHFNCPCKDCLIKMMCKEMFDERCDSYKNIINKYISIYYDEITGMYKTKEELEYGTRRR
jgi:hypothetical protein